MTVSVVVQVILFALSAALPIWGLLRLYIKTVRDAKWLLMMSNLIRNWSKPEDGPFSPRVRDEDVVLGRQVEAPYVESIEEALALARRVRGDFVWVGLGVLCGAVASIWSLLEAALAS